jgi:small conductance mechanosensitive channel
MGEWLLAGGRSWAGAAGGVALALAVAWLFAEIVARTARRALLVLMRGHADDVSGPIVRRPIRVLRASVFVITALLLVLPSLRLGGIESRVGPQPEALARWLFSSGLRIALVVLVGHALIWLSATLIRRFEQELAGDTTIAHEERLKRVRTLGGVLQSVFGAAVALVGLLMILRELDVDITPVLTGAGIVGLGVGFGAQTLVKDVISGFFLILENQVRVGDVVAINGCGGLVEAINLRTIVLRDVEGTVHIFPNGTITTLANRTKDYSYALLDVAMAFGEDVDRVTALLHRIGAELAADPEFGPRLLEPLEVMGMEGLSSVQVTVRIRVKTLPRRQWEVARELRRRIKRAFDAEHIRMRTPPTLSLGSSPGAVEMRGGSTPPRP